MNRGPSDGDPVDHPRMALDPMLRLATEGDAEVLARLRWDFSTEDAAAERDDFLRFRDRFVAFVHDALARGDWAIWVAEVDRRIVAHVYVELVGKVPRPGRGGT